MLPWVGPPLALAAGMLFALAGLSAFPSESKKLSRLIIQVCIVLLGLRIELGELMRHAGSGLLFAAGTILAAFALGFALQRFLKTSTELTLLISSGTAICGGSAIGAVSAAIGASSSSVSVATGAIFLLNAAALYCFPPIGHALGLSDTQFGTWAGVAIHDMSSVVGAGAAYRVGATEALDTANLVKLSRVIWILPCTLFAAWIIARERRETGKASIQTSGGDRKSLPLRVMGLVPFFIILFLVASLVRTALPVLGDYEAIVNQIAKAGFACALFLIGSGLSLSTLRSVGWRALVQAFILWVALATASLVVVVRTVN